MESIIDQIKELEGQRDRGLQMVKDFAKLERLFENEDFKAVIMDDFCKDNVVRLTHLSTDPRLAQPERDDALGTAQAGGYLLRFLMMQEKRIEQVKRELEAIDEQLKELHTIDEEDIVEQESYQ